MCQYILRFVFVFAVWCLWFVKVCKRLLFQQINIGLCVNCGVKLTENKIAYNCSRVKPYLLKCLNPAVRKIAIVRWYLASNRKVLFFLNLRFVYTV